MDGGNFGGLNGIKICGGIVLSDIPVALRQRPNWVCWKTLVRDGRPSKVPFDIRTGQWAKANDPATWTTYEKAVEAADVLNGSDYDGIGFELHGTNLVGIDFDNAINSKGVVDSYALALLKVLGSPYTEVSPSGTGLHSFVECDVLPAGGRKLSNDHNGIEIYHGREGGRYFTMTGEKVLGRDIPVIPDMTIPYLLITKNKDKKFKALWLGDISTFEGDESSADFALMREIARLTKSDPALMEKFFGLSALAQRDKWTGREDYRQRTIKAAIDTERTGKPVAVSASIEFHTPARPDPDGEYVVSPAPGQEDGWFPLGDISLIGGASGTGKTTWIFEMLHKQKQGHPVFDHRTHHYMFQVLAYDRGRNAFTRTMRRLNLLPSDIPTTALPLAFGTEAVQAIINEIEKMNPIPHVIFIEGLDMLLDDANKKSVVSPFMRQLQETAAHFHIALICSVGAPKTKRGEDYAAKRDKLSGSEAWGRNCETVCVLEFAEEDDGTTPQRSLTILPRNAPAEKFTLEFQGGRLVPVQPTADKEVQEKQVGKETQKAMKFLEDQLQDGPKGAAEIVSLAHAMENISRSTLYNAAEELHIRKGPRGVIWELPPMNAQLAQNRNTTLDYEIK
jgi:AAA domain